MNTPRAGVIMRHNDVYLCVYQSASKLWGFPKGRLKIFEHFKDGACRELFEETGIYISPKVLNQNIMIHIKRGKHHHHYYIHDIDKMPNVHIDMDEIIDYKWMTLDQLASMCTSFFTEQVIKRLRDNKSINRYRFT